MDDYYEDGREIFDEDPDDKNGKKGGAAAKKAASGTNTGLFLCVLRETRFYQKA